MIPHQALINALRELGYRFKEQSQRVEIYKKPGRTHRPVVHKRDYHDETYVRGVLASCGMSRDEIDKFVAATKVDKP